jgi:hypothetical protein
MRIDLIFTLKKPKGVTTANWYSDKNMAFRDQVTELMLKADVIRVTLKDNTKWFMAEVNKVCGVCDDCTGFKLGDIKKYEFFKLGN